LVHRIPDRAQCCAHSGGCESGSSAAGYPVGCNTVQINVKVFFSAVLQNRIFFAWLHGINIYAVPAPAPALPGKIKKKNTKVIKRVESILTVYMI
jgi:hypothetical protein